MKRLRAPDSATAVQGSSHNTAIRKANPRILGRYVREQPAVLTLEEAVHKMTGFPASRMSFRDRGTVAEGNVADLVVFDPETVIDQATFDDPHRYPLGMPHVLVSGELIVADGNHTGARPGRVLRRRS